MGAKLSVFDLESLGDPPDFDKVAERLRELLLEEHDKRPLHDGVFLLLGMLMGAHYREAEREK